VLGVSAGIWHDGRFSMLHRLGNLSSDFDGFTALVRLAAHAGQLERDEFELSFASLSKLDANMAAPLGAVLATVVDRGNPVLLTDVPRYLEDLLCRNGFLPNFGYPAPDRLSSTALPYVCFKMPELDPGQPVAKTRTQLFYDYLETHLQDKGLPEITSDFPLRLQMCLGEVFANAETHSDSNVGVFVCGQFYPTQQRLDITIADAGITIPERFLRRFNVFWEPLRILRWALKEGKTTKQGTPGGVGLKLLREFICDNQGRVQIASGRAFWQFQNGKDEFSELENALPATVVTVAVNTANWHVPASPPPKT
jgi:hypothetical protein